MFPPFPQKPFKPGLIYGVAEEWYSTPQGRKLVSEIDAHNKGILEKLFGKDAFLEYDPQVFVATGDENVAYIHPSDIPQSDNAPLNADTITDAAGKGNRRAKV